MRAVGLVSAVAAAILACQVAAAETTCPRLQGFVLPLEQQDGAYLVRLKIAGTPRLLLLQMDAGFSKLDEAIADELHLPRKRLPRGMRVADGGGDYTQIATAPTITLGPVTRNDAEMLTGAHRQGWGKADGVAGMNFFYGLDAELDLAHNRLGLYLPRDCDFLAFWPFAEMGEAPLAVEPTGTMHLPMVLDGQKIEASLSTSDVRTYMPFDAARMLFGIKDDDPRLIPAGSLPSGAPLYRFAFKALVGGEKVTVKDPEIYIYRSPKHQCGGVAGRWRRAGTSDACFGGGDVELGTALLGKLHLFFAFKQKKVYFTLAEPPPQ